MKYTSREIFGIVLILFVGLLSLGAWYSFSRIILVPGMGDTWQTFVWFFALLSVFVVGAVVWENPLFRVLGAIVVFLPSIMFIFSWYHLLISCFSVFFAWWSVRVIQNEIHDRIRFRFFTVVRSGKLALVFALSLSLSSAYFAFSQHASWEELMPRFHMNQGGSILTFRAVSYLYPDLKKAADDRATVDEFLVSMSERQEDTTALGETVSQNTMDILKNVLYGFPGSKNPLQPMSTNDLNKSNAMLQRELYVRSGKEQISSFVGRTVSGDEKIADVFSLAVEHKIVSLFGSDGEVSKTLPSGTLPLILATILFLTLMPLGSILGPVFTFVGFCIFSGAKALHFVRITSRERTQDILEA